MPSEIVEATQRQTGNLGVAIQAYLRRSEGDLERLKPQYRAQIASQGFTLVPGHVRKLDLEA